MAFGFGFGDVLSSQSCVVQVQMLLILALVVVW